MQIQERVYSSTAAVANKTELTLMYSVHVIFSLITLDITG